MTESGDIIILNRDCTALMVPSGARIMLHEGTEVTVTQALGDSFTVNIYGNLARIDAKDADALGKEIRQPLDELPDDASIDDKVSTQLKTVYDPEIPVNVVDLGLIYNVDIKPQQDNTYIVLIKMTLTSPGCGMGPTIVADVHDKVKMIPEVAEVDVDMVFDPPWERSMMSEAAQLELGMM